MQADDCLSLLLLEAQHLHDKLTYTEPVVTDSVIVQAQIDDNKVLFSLHVLVDVVNTTVSRIKMNHYM